MPLSILIDRVKNEKIGKKIIIEFLLGMDSFNKSLGEHFDQNKIANIIREAEYTISGICMSILLTIAHKEGKRIFGYKSTKTIDRLAMFFVRGRFSREDKIIHIVRDCRDVMASLVSVGWISPNKTYFGILWASHNILINKLLCNSPNYHLVKYENFVINPQGKLREICKWIGVDFESTMVDREKRSPRYRAMQSIHGRIYSNIDDTKMCAWKELPANLIEKFSSQAFEGLSYFDYVD